MALAVALADGNALSDGVAALLAETVPLPETDCAGDVEALVVAAAEAELESEAEPLTDALPV